MRGYARVARRRFFALRDHATAWPGAAWSWVCKFVANWWTEIRAFCLPLVIVFLAICSPDIGLPVSLDASIGAVAAVQAAVTGLSLIALVLAVELARRQEDRDDTVYEIMLRSAWIRPTFLFAIAALLATLIAIAIRDFSVGGNAMPSANLLLSVYVLTGLVGIALLWTVLRTVRALKPTGIIGFRFSGNDAERREKVEDFISRTRKDYPAMDPIQQAILPVLPVALTASERLMIEVDAALQSQQGGRFSGALERIKRLISNSADQIAGSALGFQPPGIPPHGYWFPLDAVNDRTPELWRASFERLGLDFVREMLSLQYFLLAEGIERRSGELLEAGLRSGLAAYWAAAQVDRHEGYALHEWVGIDSMWYSLSGPDSHHRDPVTLQFAARLVEHLQEYGNMLLVADDAGSFRQMLEEFGQRFEAWDRKLQFEDYADDVELVGIRASHDYAVLALLALGGHAMLLGARDSIVALDQYWDPILKMIGTSLPIDRLVPAASVGTHGLHQEWMRWEIPANRVNGVRTGFVQPDRYPMLALLAQLLASESTEPLPSLGGYAQQFIATWTAHQDLLLGVAGIAPDDRTDAIDRFSARLATAKAAEEREDEDLHLSAPLDQERVSRFLENLRLWRRNDRVVEMCFEQVGRVRRLEEGDWGDEGGLGGGLLLPRAFFVDDVALTSPYAEWIDKRLVDGVEKSLVSMMAAGIEGSSEVHDAPSADLAHLMLALDDALMALGVGRQVIVFVGEWPNDLHSTLRLQMYDRDHGELLPVDSQHHQVTGAYKGHRILRIPTAAEPAIAVLNLERWGWLVRAPVDGEDFGVGLNELDQAEAEERARDELPDDADEGAVSERVRQLRLRVRVRAEERTRFEVENPDAARIIRVAASSDDSIHSAA